MIFKNVIDTNRGTCDVFRREPRMCSSRICLIAISCRPKKSPKVLTRAVNIAGACEPAPRFASPHHISAPCSRTAIANPSYGRVPHPRLANVASSTASSTGVSAVNVVVGVVVVVVLASMLSPGDQAPASEAARQEPRKYDKSAIIRAHLAHSRVPRNLARSAP